MPYQDEIITNLIVNRGLLAKLIENIGSIGNDEFILTEDLDFPIPTINDIGKALKVNSTGTGFVYEYTNNIDDNNASANTTYSSNKIVSLIPTIPTTLPASVLITEPTSDNTNGLIFVHLASEPTTKYNGYIYLIDEE